MSSEDPTIRELNEKMDTVVKVVQDFGLTFIQNIGSLKHEMQVLTDQVDNLNKIMLDMKGLGVKIDEINKRNKRYQEDIKHIKSLISSIKMGSKSATQIEISPKADENKTARDYLADFSDSISEIRTSKELVDTLEDLKETLFKITGGHRILFEINKEINAFKKIEELNDDKRDELGEKVQFWINKIG